MESENMKFARANYGKGVVIKYKDDPEEYTIKGNLKEDVVDGDIYCELSGWCVFYKGEWAKITKPKQKLKDRLFVYAGDIYTLDQTQEEPV